MVAMADYAHHPSEIDALLTHVQDTYGSKLVVIFQPTNIIGASLYDQKEKVSQDKQAASGQRKGIIIHSDGELYISVKTILIIYTLSLLMTLCCCVCTGRLSNVPASMIPDQFGMAGLVNLIRSAQSDQSMMTLVPGIDLTTLGLNMTYPE